MTPPGNLKPIIHDTGRKKWQNWHETVNQPLKKLLDIWNAQPATPDIQGYNATTKGLQKIIKDTLRDGLQLRAFGGGWSFSKVAATDGVLLNTKPMNYHFWIEANNLNPAYTGDHKNLVFAQCGMSLAELNGELALKGKSLKTSGASNGQTIAGALATGTHGSAIDVGSIPDYVVGIHLVVSPTKSVWLERASAPVVADAFPGVLGATLKRDDDLFNAALVSFGGFGLVHGVMVEATDLYYLHATRQLMPLDDGLWKALEGLDFSDLTLPRPTAQRPFHFQLVINPFDLDSGVYVTIMYKDKTRAAGCKPPPTGSKITQGDSALEVMGTITDTTPDITEAMVNLAIKLAFKEIKDICGTHGETFKDTTTRGKASSSAMGIPLNQVRHALDKALKEIADFPAPVLVALRFVRSSQATLAFTSHPGHTCILEIDGPKSRRVTSLNRRIWRAFDKAGIDYRFHWGKINNLDAARVRKSYGTQRVDKWIAARRKLLKTDELRALFSNEFMKRCQLDD